jgi:hypothetical protein
MQLNMYRYSLVWVRPPRLVETVSLFALTVLVGLGGGLGGL